MFAIIGGGNVGSALGEFLEYNGLLDWIYVRSEKSYMNIVKLIPEAKIIRNINNITEFPKYTILAVSDDSLNDIAAKIHNSFENLKGKYFSHCSGTLGKDELLPLKQSSATIAAVHPYQTFFESSKETLNGIPWGIDCDGKDETEFTAMVKQLNGTPVILNEKAKNLKELYHISAVSASNYLNTLISLSSSILKEIDLPPEIFLKPIIETTLENNFKNINIEDKSPLTGPIIRGDIGILEKHIKALESYPDLLHQYKLIGLATLESAYSKNMLNKEKYDLLQAVLK